MVLLGKAWSLNLAILEMACFPSGLPGAALAQLAAIVNPANKPIQIEMHLQAQIGRWTKTWLSYSVFEKKLPLSNCSFFFKKNGSPNFVLPQKRTLQTIHEFQNNLEKIATIATLATNQEPTLYIYVCVCVCHVVFWWLAIVLAWCVDATLWKMALWLCHLIQDLGGLLKFWTNNKTSPVAKQKLPMFFGFFY